MQTRNLIRFMFTAALLVLFNQATTAAEITFKSSQKTKAGTITIRGDLIEGDQNRFEEIVQDLNKRGILVNGVRLRSRGGAVRAAMAIGTIVRERGMYTHAPYYLSAAEGRVSINNCFDFPKSTELNLLTGEGDPNCECTSACALIWAGGMQRFGERVGFHRPYLDKDQIRRLKFSETERHQNEILSEVKSYLTSMGIPNRIIDAMSAASSQDIYFLSERETEKLKYDPALEEWLISKCPYNPEETLTRDEETLMENLSLKEVYEKVGIGPKLSALEVAAFERLRQRENYRATCYVPYVLLFKAERQGVPFREDDAGNVHSSLGETLSGVILEFRNVRTVRRVVDGAQVVVVEGLVANTTDEPQPIPLLRASLTDAEGTEIETWTFAASVTTLPANGSAGFKTIAKNPPSEGRILIDFVSVE